MQAILPWKLLDIFKIITYISQGNDGLRNNSQLHMRRPVLKNYLVSLWDFWFCGFEVWVRKLYIYFLNSFMWFTCIAMFRNWLLVLNIWIYKCFQMLIVISHTLTTHMYDCQHIYVAGQLHLERSLTAHQVIPQVG